MVSEDELWQAAGISPTARRSFEEWKIDVATAIEWHRAGVADGVAATRWKIAKVAPAEVSLWRSAGVGSIEALQWSERGYGLEDVKQAKAGGLDPSQAHSQGPPPSGSGGSTRMSFGTAAHHIRGPNGEEAGPAFQAWFTDRGHSRRTVHLYMMTGWMSDDALPWAQADIAPDAARMWMMLGVRPSEAARMEEADTKPSEVVREWWGAGIPIDQVAAWLGAGMTPAEAAEQIAAGVTPDQAAVMRALRDEDYED